MIPRPTRLISACLTLAAATLLAWSGVTSGRTGEGTVGLAQLGIESWDSGAGLRSNWVRAVLENPDGTLWVGTTGGLMRFNGRTFFPIAHSGHSSLPQRAVNALAASVDGGLWVGFEYGGVHHVGPRPVAAPALPEALIVHDLAVLDDGSLIIASNEGVWRYAGGVTRRVAPPGIPHAVEVRRLAQGFEGEVWARSTVHGLWRIDGLRAVLVEDAPGCRGFDIAAGPDGERFTSCTEGVWRWPPGGNAWEQLSDDFAVGPIHLDRVGALWFGARTGLSRWSRGRIERLPPALGPGDWRVRAFAEDRRGDLWIGTFSSGLAHLHLGPVRTFGGPEGLDVDGTTGVLVGVDGRLWIGEWRQGLVRFDPVTRAVERWTAEDGLPGETVWALAADRQTPGAIWIGGDLGIARWVDGHLHAFDAGSLVSAMPVRVLHTDEVDPETLWLAGDLPGLASITDGQPRIHDSPPGLRKGRVRFFHRNRAGRLLCGGDGGLFGLDGAEWSALVPGDSRVAALTAIAEHEDGSLWVASNRSGVIRIDEDRIDIWDLDAGLPFLQVHSLGFDADGGLWLSGNEGLARISVADHRRWRAGELPRIPVAHLKRRDGLRDVETNGWGYPPSTVFGDGRIAYPTLGGVAILDTRSLPAVGLSPQEIMVHGAWSGPRAIPLDGPIRLGRHERSLRIAFSAIEMLRPEAVSFRFRLEGVDADWIAAPQSLEAAWSPLPPGRHRFRLQARMPDQAWVEADGDLEVEVEPLPWESTALRLLAFGLCILVVGAIISWRRDIGRRHAAALARNRAFLREVIDTSPNPIFVRGRDGTCNLANRAATELLGIHPEVPGEPGSALSDGTSSGNASIDAVDAAVIAEGTEHLISEQALPGPEGQRRWFRVVKRPGFGVDGQTVEQVIVTAVDVTEFKLAQQRLEREQERLRHSREEARALSRRLLNAQEEERRRLAQEIHDDLTQQLAGLSLLAWSTAKAMGSGVSAERREGLETIARELERLAKDVQSLSHELHPPALDEFGLVEALRIECLTFARRTGLSIGFQGHVMPFEPPVEVGLALYRITQEALRNCLEHAGASAVAVSIEGNRGRLRLRVADDGAGFDVARQARRTGLGISGMRERARLAGAAFSIESAPGRGTTVSVTWPDRRGQRLRPGRVDEGPEAPD